MVMGNKMAMKFSTSKPPIFDKLHKAFGVEWGKGLVIAYKDTIHHSQPLHPSVIVHEQVHLNRQGKDPDLWYENYIRNEKFRFGEELLAYHAQYDYLMDVIRDRNELAKWRWKLAVDLSGPMYGKVVSHKEAMKLIAMK